ncbi:excinuclease ABC subunit A [Parabacteroides sp. PF5-5]|uniref:excinuclease ABC subunit UvrA n=1 Tax=unclassified Parabacteroides TaxID=2649774 RepID=UPI002475DB85|nr:MULTISPECIES: excinuclease ABC subunit UvrA [unclassified Parabacteroides]MDH6304421.1 excinuclease ABC subunit A [Parabacteroides sp. PH5-39]MDH6315426.1 excinuclease ABC subunit A [Parabacteroides sp. PF5-13]MDH6319080.1 excinuclease ABC subunit A [Parabacteroides sp. PH5-13]MDH6322810.1 excinuclease ABC subunit A [Parabacteroides sp. PH5-8]MDH6326618.1 excinuclease ABC subunit A [Parabacteroides sp. PH5-41]
MIKDKNALEGGLISVLGARVHNLKNIDIDIPRNSLTVLTGMSGSGKSSLAFDTIFAEGQRRYVETFSAYARHFLGNMDRPDVDKITGLSPVISIEQKTTNRNPRSTVGTTTEVYDFFRLLYARAGEAYSYLTGEKMVKYTEEQVLNLIIDKYQGKKTYILAPLVRNRKGHYKELFEQVRKKGYLSVRVDGELREILHGMKLDRYKNHSIEVVIDKLVISKSDERRLKESLKVAMKQGDGLIMVFDADTNEIRHYSRRLMDPKTGLSYSEPAPHNFSFNSPQGACHKCKGLGQVNLLDIEKIVPNPSLSIYNGGIVALGKYKNSLIFWQIEAICEKYGVTIKTPIKDLPEEAIDDIMNGTDERLQIKNASLGNSNYFLSYEGVAKYIMMQQESEASASAQKWAGQFIKMSACPECNGQRLNKEALHYKIADKNIAEISTLDISELYEWLEGIEERLDEKQRQIAVEILKEIRSRLKFLLDVGLEYLSMGRASASLSGGESQRIRLATQIGSQLVNVLYILDEPSIGLHQRDNVRLINSLKQLRDTGNSVIVVEHDKEMMLSADYVVDLGPRAGRLGGEIVFAGTPEEMLKADTLTSAYLNGKMKIEIPPKRRKGNGKYITIKGARGNNLKKVDVSFPLGLFLCVTGVSGSGKSTLINQTLQPILSQHFYRSLEDPLPYDSVEGINNIDKVVNVDQSPIGRSPRSNPATYTGVFSDIRSLFVELPESKIRGYKPGRFSFNVSGGRCETCKGNGYKAIEMNFLPDVLVPCEECHGKRYNRETLEVRFRGKSIAEVLDMTINMAVEFFENVPTILHKIKVLQDVGLGYIKLGQPSTTLSGGESQRVKLATELAKRDTGKTLYILDEPTTGLHFEDIRVLLGVLNKLVDKGNTVIVIEHNMDIIKSADYLIDIGPVGGRKGGNILFTGPPEKMLKNTTSLTSQFLAEELRS